MGLHTLKFDSPYGNWFSGLKILTRNGVYGSLFVLAMTSTIFLGCSANEQADSVTEGMNRTIATVSIPAPVFSGIDQSGSEFTSTSLRGSKWIASFFFTACQTVCPRLNAKQKDLIREFNGKVKLVSISTDPVNDNGEVLAEYARSYNAMPGSWWMITMPEESMHEVSKVGFAVIDPKEPSMHTTRLVAVDENMTIKGYYDSEEPSDIELLKKWIASH